MTPERFPSPHSQTGHEPTLRNEAASPAGRLLLFPAPLPRPACHRTRRPSRAWLLGEFAVLFLALPLIFFFHLGGPLPLLPTLWAAAASGLVLLLRDPSFDRTALWNARPLGKELPQILGLFAAGAVIITALLWRYAPSALLAMPRHDPRLWISIMLSYPIVSVYPQSIIYRAFFFHRYQPLFGAAEKRRAWPMILASAATFSFAHIVFHNWIAVVLTLAGGILFALRYRRTQSLCVAFVEHTLYGWLMFTVGLGHFFIAGTL